MKIPITTILFACAMAAPLRAQAVPQDQNSPATKLLDRIVERERALLQSIRQSSPLVETYIQEFPQNSSSEDDHPIKDHYFLGRFRVGAAIEYQPLLGGAGPAAPPRHRFMHSAPKADGMAFLPRGFAQMAVPDSLDFNRQTYHFDYVRREFLGEIRCFVFDVAPINRAAAGKFIGRIWVEDQDDSIVRFNGTYVEGSPAKGEPPEHYFHFDSWRVNAGPGLWVPAQIYVEEQGESDATSGPSARFKAQTRIWDYTTAPAHRLDELTNILIESGTGVKDPNLPKDISPLESERAWERQAEENVLGRLEKGGFLAPPGPVDDVLNTVVNNLIVAANLNVEARCRVLLTTPLETFSIGNTIVISRGLIDVLPDEASLALMLARELSHIALGHRTPTQFAFNNQTMLSDAELFERLHFERSPEEIAAAGKKTIEIMRASPYKKTANAGLFLKELASHSAALPYLLKAHLGEEVGNADALARLEALAAAAPALEEDKLEQIAALPLGSRVKLNPWSNRAVLVKTVPVALLSPREKMPFEVTPFMLYLTRFASAAPAPLASPPR